MSFIAVVLVVLFSFTTVSASSLDGGEGSFADIFRLMTNADVDTFSTATIGFPSAYYTKGRFLVIRNVKFHFDRAKDNPWDQRFTNGGEPIRVTKGIEFLNCEFPDTYWLVFRSMIFEESIGFRECKNMKLIFRESTFMHYFYYLESEATFLQFRNCSFNLGFRFGDKSKIIDYAEFNECKFSYNEEHYRHPLVNESQNVIKSLYPLPEYFRFENPIEPNNLYLKKCTFSTPPALAGKPKLVIDLNHSTFKTLEILDCDISPTLDISFVTVENQMKLFNNSLRGFVVAEAFSFNPSNAKVQWEKLAGRRLAVNADTGAAVFTGYNISEGNDYNYQTLISVYALLYQMYRSQGSRLSANNCYIEWKDIETEYFRRLMRVKPTAEIRFTWLMNAFLRTFCDYGTNPMKSMIWSLGVMIGFAIFYVAFPRQSGIAEQEAFLERIHAFGEYFTHGKSLEEIERKLEKVPDETADERANLSSFIRHNKVVLPFYYRLFGIQLVKTRRYSASFQRWYARFADRLVGRWAEASKKRRFRVAIVFSCGLLMSLGGLFVVRLFDAFFLSINAFSTLGFGDIPLRGAAKYLAIAEGFIGWFLLSIFSVALISQIIQ